MSVMRTNLTADACRTGIFQAESIASKKPESIPAVNRSFLLESHLQLVGRLN